MDVALEVISGLLDELAAKIGSAQPDHVREAFVRAIENVSADELEQHARAFEQLGAVGLAHLCRVMAVEELPMLY